jgi:hypothetical protein
MKRRDDVVADLEPRDAVSDLDHLCGVLVSRHDRGRERQRAVLNREVGMADPRGADRDLDLSRLGARELDSADLNGFVVSDHDSRLGHTRPSPGPGID